MPPKGKAAHRSKGTESKSSPAAGSQASASSASPAARQQPPQTINEQSRQRYEQTRPYDKAVQELGLSGLSTAERTAYVNSHYLRAVTPAACRRILSNRAQKELWRGANEASLPLRALPRPTDWGTDRFGRDVGEYSPAEFRERCAQQARLTALEAAHRTFLDKRRRAERGFADPDSGGNTGEQQQSRVVLAEADVAEERQRRKDIAALRMELYGERTDPYALDPEWDDVVPIPLDEPEGALAAIAYPENYAEAVSYLRAVMAAEEHSPRCLRLTEHVISLNPAHYTVWLYRFSIIAALGLSVPDELAWVNEVALQHLKNYQIWHHRQLLVDLYYPRVSAQGAEAVAELAREETRFLREMLAEDAKNYHVWSYRQYLVRKLGRWGDEELAATAEFIDEDVRNNSAWSHRFFVVFADPAASTPGAHSTAPDPAVPAEVVRREIAYAQDKILLAPQNQSPWNYLRGVLVKGGLPLATVEAFAAQFVANIGGEEEEEEVRSTHALDLLAEICAEKGEAAKADLYLRRLAEKWDRIRAGYWEWRRKMLAAPEEET